MTLPTFLIIGAMRSGTTTLARTLGEHPDVFMVRDKELHYFDTWPDRGRRWYESRFREAAGQRVVGEATPNYMYVRGAIERAAALLPRAKLLAILRDPVERAYSHYWWNRLRGREPLGFVDALDAEPERLRGDVRGGPLFAYVGKGRYTQQLKHVCSLYPREALHVVILDDLEESPERTFHDVCRFLEVDAHLISVRSTAHLNSYYEVRSQGVGRLVRRLASKGRLGRLTAAVPARLNRLEVRYPSMEREARAKLRRIFEPEIQELEAWLGRDLSMWAGRDAQSRVALTDR